MVKLSEALIVATQEGKKEVIVTVEAPTLTEAKGKIRRFVDEDFGDYHIMDRYIKEVSYYT
jgi:hypothetical protein